MKKRNSASIECLNGLRSLSLLWIIYGHRYFDTFRSPATNYEYAVELWLRNIWSLTHTMFHLAVDTFFLIGGLLVTQSLMRSFDAWVTWLGLSDQLSSHIFQEAIQRLEDLFPSIPPVHACVALFAFVLRVIHVESWFGANFWRNDKKLGA